jgi:hypothetical protein
MHIDIYRTFLKCGTNSVRNFATKFLIYF